MGQRRGIGLWEAPAIGVGGMVGGGIFAVLGLAVELVGDYVPPIVNCFAGTQAGLSALQVNGGTNARIGNRGAPRPESSLRPETAVLTDWPADRWAPGAASYGRPGQPLAPLGV